MRSCESRDSLRTRRPNQTIGSTTAASSTMMIDDSLTLVTNSIASPPTNSRTLRSAIEMLVPTTAWISVVSAVRRDNTSPLWVVSKNCGLCVMTCRIDRAADVGRDALAQPRHDVKARRGRNREHAGHAEQREKIQIDVLDALGAGGAETEVDHLLERIRNRERGAGGNDAARCRPARIGACTGRGRETAP